MELRGCTQVRDFSLLSLSLSKLDISDCKLFAEGGKALAAGLKGNQAITELNVSNNFLGMDSDHDGDISGIIAIADVIGDGAMTSLHVGMNAIPEKEMKEIIVIAMSKDSMKLLCEVPIKDKTLTELDVSGKSLGTEGALVVAEYLRDNGAMTSLNLASNNLRAEGAKIVAEAIKVTKCTPAVILVPFSSPSGFSINCCCLLLSAGYGGVDQDRPQQEQHPVRSGGEAPAHLRGWRH